MKFTLWYCPFRNEIFEFYFSPARGRWVLANDGLFPIYVEFDIPQKIVLEGFALLGHELEYIGETQRARARAGARARADKGCDNYSKPVDDYSGKVRDMKPDLGADEI